MYKDKRFLAIIPARSGSKGLINKNIKELNGKPMIAYTIEAAIKSRVFDDIIVSTDSQEYADIAIQYGAKVPFLRPNHLSTDESTTNEVIVHCLNELSENRNEYDYFMILQPTSPLRTSIDIVDAVDLLFEKKANSIVSVCESEHSPMYMNTINESLSLREFISKDVKMRRQELPKYYRLNGAIYLSDVINYLSEGDLYGENSYAYVMNKKNSIDVDDELDFNIAEYLIINR